MKALAQLALLFLATMSIDAANYSAERLTIDGVEVVRLSDAAHKSEALIAPSMGNNAYDLKVNGKHILWVPFRNVAEWKAKPVQAGNPFLAPWANRIDSDAYYANGKKYVLNPELKNFRYDQFHQPIHGLIGNTADWQITFLQGGSKSAQMSARLEFWRHPDWMEQFPFAHTYNMTYRLADGVLEVETSIENLSRDPMPVSIGYHTYYQLSDTPRNEWKIHIPARDQVVLNEKLTPTGEIKPMPFARPLPLSGKQLDDVFTNLERDARGRADFRVEGARESITVSMGPNYKVGVVWAPPGREFICFEPMSGVTNAFNLAHAGKYAELQTIAPGSTWRESFWIKASGF